MQAGRFRHRVAIESEVEVRNADGDLVSKSWVAVKPNLPADIQPVSARELLSSGTTQSECSARIVIRWFAGLDAKMRIRRLDDGRIYNIAGLVEDNRSGREWITVPVTEGVNDG